LEAMGAPVLRMIESERPLRLAPNPRLAQRVLALEAAE